MKSTELIKNYLLLKTVNGISDRIIFNLYQRFGTLENIFEISKEELIKNFNQNIAELIDLKKCDQHFVDNELKFIEKYSIQTVLLEDEHYPALLKEITHPPAILYLIGDKTVLKKPSIAIVGSRKASNDSINFTKKLASDLAEIGFNVVSGFAAGIDIAAHIGALNKGSTTAVLGNGLKYIYPQEHKKFIKKIVKNGCLLTEFEFETKPLAYNFPKRNRIIAGMSSAVVVVEAASKSGSLITAKIAMEENREVFAVPAPVWSKNRGTNELIKTGAKLVENYLDILEELTSFMDVLKEVDKKESDNNITFDDELEEKIFSLLKENPKSVDEICTKLNHEYVEILNKLSEMELKGVIYQGLDGKYHQGSF